MNRIGLFDAKTHLSEICEKVAASGEPVILTRRGLPLVRIEPAAQMPESGSQIWDRSNQLRKQLSSGKLSELKIPKRAKLKISNPLKEK